jgi:hypothetical protein
MALCGNGLAGDVTMRLAGYEENDSTGDDDG